MKAFFLVSSLAFGLLLTGCETTVVEGRHHRSGAYYDNSPGYVGYADVRHHNYDYDHSDRVYDRDVVRTNVQERNVSRTNVNVVNVNRRNVTRTPAQNQAVVASNRNVRVESSSNAQVHGKKVKKQKKDEDQDNH